MATGLLGNSRFSLPLLRRAAAATINQSGAEEECRGAREKSSEDIQRAPSALHLHVRCLNVEKNDVIEHKINQFFHPRSD